ncbi:CS1 type fimbrial major subunit [Yersinia mollaretii]|uniref:Alpha-related fimbriae minor subunit 1 n=1 Tax=Yersinia mollaretii TaxID=33060 RepID=A0AA36LS92_YERMO|nr:CS1 type fimbrial major subunit [Yersinia mollaretii]CNI22099.1 alpha-related fimbriae minor subunit 1 [Yersinia mollaretii]
MMKKTLFSIITMVIVTSSSAYAAHSLQKDILVEAEISEPLILTKADGSPFNGIQLEYKPEKWNGIGSHLMFSPAKLTVKQPIKITANQGVRVKLSLAENFYMSDIKGGNGLLSPDVFIDENMLQGVDDDHEFTPDKGVQELRVEAEVPEDAKPGDKYTGVLKLVMESVP